MGYIIEETKTEVEKRKIPITEDMAQMFHAIIEDRKVPKLEKVIDGHTGFLFYDKKVLHGWKCIGSTDLIVW